jgi:hypothetical protein
VAPKVTPRRAGRIEVWLRSRLGKERLELPRAPSALSWEHRSVMGWLRVTITMKLDPAQAARTLRLAAGAVGACCAADGGTVGCIGIVPGEEPVAAAFAALRDLVAGKVLGALTAVPMHRHPQLLLALGPGVYLASVVDPLTPFAFDEERLVAWVDGGAVGFAMLVEVVTDGRGTALRFTGYGSRRRLVSALRICRNTLRELGGAFTTR